MATGRDKFEKFKFFINTAASICKIFPRFLRIFIWDVLSRYSQVPFIALRYIIFKSLAKSCGDNVGLGRNLTIIYWERIEVGNNVSIHDNCYIDASGGVFIGDEVSIAHNTSILTNNHSWDQQDVPIKYNPTVPGAVRIFDDVWIGCGCRILAGVQIQSRSIIAAGAVVNKNIESNTIVGGVPAKKIKSI
jgi:acetyltransferase-like isoleucine patch superfamily enzyme